MIGHGCHTASEDALDVHLGQCQPMLTEQPFLLGVGVETVYRGGPAHRQVVFVVVAQVVCDPTHYPPGHVAVVIILVAPAIRQGCHRMLVCGIVGIVDPCLGR